MSRVRHDLVTRLWRGRDPFLDLPPDLRDIDMRGASAGHAYFSAAVVSGAPGVVVDVGAGKGGSTLAFARELRSGKMNAVVVAVDTFLGDVSDWQGDDEFEEMEYEAGRSSLYPRFVSNVLRAGLGNFVLPLTLDANTAAGLFKQFGIPASVVHLDADADPASIRAYLEAWWPLVKPGGVLIGGPCANGQDAARKAYEDFFRAQGVPVTFQDGKCQATKPGGAGQAAAPAAAFAPPAAETPAAEAAPQPAAQPAPAAAAPTPPEPAPAAAQEAPKSAPSFRLGGRPAVRNPENV
jgi:hypothetical protein